jgi:hypothetical protein
MSTEHKACYGTMFHDTLHHEVNEEMKGKAFSFELVQFGLARQDRKIEVDMAEWDDCVACHEFDHCYRLCMAKLTLASAISDQ